MEHQQPSLSLSLSPNSEDSGTVPTIPAPMLPTSHWTTVIKVTVYHDLIAQLSLVQNG